MGRYGQHHALVGGYDLLGEFADYNLFEEGKGTFEVDTESWVAYGSNTIETVAFGGSRALKVTYVDQNDGAHLFFRNSTDLITDLTIGKKYRAKGRAAVSASSSVNIDIYDGVASQGGSTITSETMVPFSKDFIAQSATGAFIHFLDSMGAGEIIHIDDITLQELYTPDYSGRANHGTVSGPTQTSRGYDFATNDRINLGAKSVWAMQEFTVIAEFSANATGFNKPIFDVGVGELDFHVDAGGPLEIFCADLTPTRITGTTNIEDDNLHQAAVVKNGSSIILYLDNRIEATGTMTGAITYGSNSAYIGWDTALYYFGSINKVLVYNQPLTQREIQEQMQRSRYSGGLMNL